jgi:phosphate starvation-inducible PhoH-like protein
MTEKAVSIQDMSRIHLIFGDFDNNINIIQKEYKVSIFTRDDEIRIKGDENAVDNAEQVIKTLISTVEKGETPTEQSVRYAISMTNEGKGEEVQTLTADCVCVSHTGKPIKAKTVGQSKYVNSIKKNTIVFGVGPAGTGKTYLAVALAVRAFKAHEVQRIILTRPAVEAGEKLGFLPGDLQNKVDPYLRPLYDALFDMMGSEAFQRNMERGCIEVAPLAYMRGRTLDNAFIILDEAQNTTPAQMKMFLTRIGFGSKVVITGDSTQKDLPAGTVSGLDVAVKVVKDLEGVSICSLTSKDVVRHPLVQKIVRAYEEYEKKNNPKGKNGRRKKS